MQREPHNHYGNNAIVVYWQHQKIGYVPRSHNSAQSRLMDQGHNITASVTALDFGHWQPVGFVVKLMVG